MVPFLALATLAGTAQSNGDGQHQTNPPQYDPAYERVAHGSGGQAIYMNRADAAKSAEIIDAKQNRENIAAIYGQTAPGSLEIPVDSFTTILYITLSANEAGSELRILRPSGRELEEGHGGHTTRMAQTTLVTVDHPEPGTWSADFKPRGTASIAATAKSDLFVATFEFVELRGRPGHEGYMKIEGAPPANRNMHAEFTCSDNTLQSAQVALVGNDLRELGHEEFHRTSPESADEYSGRVRIPEQPFRVIIRGTDVNGAPYQRVYAPLFTPEKQ